MNIGKMTFKEWLFFGLVLIDQIGNWLAFGNPDCTISGRVYVLVTETGGKFWKLLQRVINYAFEPIDGPEHCRQAYENERTEKYYKANALTITVFSLLIIPICIIIIRPITWLIDKFEK